MSGTKFICRGRGAVVAKAGPTGPGESIDIASSPLSLDVEYPKEFYRRDDGQQWLRV